MTFFSLDLPTTASPLILMGALVAALTLSLLLMCGVLILGRHISQAWLLQAGPPLLGCDDLCGSRASVADFRALTQNNGRFP